MPLPWLTHAPWHWLPFVTCNRNHDCSPGTSTGHADSEQTLFCVTVALCIQKAFDLNRSAAGLRMMKNITLNYFLFSCNMLILYSTTTAHPLLDGEGNKSIAACICSHHTQRIIAARSRSCGSPSLNTKRHDTIQNNYNVGSNRRNVWLSQLLT
jgi:hypothetical protein